MKTRKSITKRFKMTRSGKILYRFNEQDHFRARKTGNQKRKKSKQGVIPKSLAHQIKIGINQ